MSKTQSIKNIIETKNTIKDQMKTISCDSFEGQNFGDEGEYTCKSLYAELGALLTDITALTKAPKQFLHLSNYNERDNIYQCLQSVSDRLTDPEQIQDQLNRLKEAIRPFHIRYTSDRFVEFNDELLILATQKQELSQQLENLKLVISNKEQSNQLLKGLKIQQIASYKGLVLCGSLYKN